MLKPFLFFISASISTAVYSQDYSKYYRICNVADSLAYEGLESQALDTLVFVFKTVNYVHSEKYLKAYHLAIKLNRFEDALHFGKMIIKNSGEKNKTQTRSKDFKSSSEYKILMDSCEYYLDEYKNRVNHDYIKLIDSLHYVDQRIIRRNLSVRGKYNIKRRTLPKNRFDLDNTNWSLLSNLIDSLGFPSEQNVGSKAYYDAWIILHHNLRLKTNEDYHHRIFEFIKRGDYLPEHFSFWYEQYQNNVHGVSFFYTWESDLSNEDLKRINQNRSKFYLKGLWAFDIDKEGRKMTSKW